MESQFRFIREFKYSDNGDNVASWSMLVADIMKPIVGKKWREREKKVNINKEII